MSQMSAVLFPKRKMLARAGNASSGGGCLLGQRGMLCWVAGNALSGSGECFVG